MHWTDLPTAAKLTRIFAVGRTRAEHLDMSNEPHDPRIDALVLDLVAWVAKEPRPYAEVMEAWRTSCPRLAVWEEAVDRGLLASQVAAQGGVLVAATPAGRRLLLGASGADDRVDAEAEATGA
jgi:hypothetical protein